jgi:hypothetical protein
MPSTSMLLVIFRSGPKTAASNPAAKPVPRVMHRPRPPAK